MKAWSTLFVLWLTINGSAYHFNRSYPLNERNSVFGAEYVINETFAVECNRFINSFGHTSTACNGIYKQETGFGFKLGGVMGYSERVDLFPLPSYIFEYGDVKVDLSLLPNVAIGLVKIKF